MRAASLRVAFRQECVALGSRHTARNKDIAVQRVEGSWFVIVVPLRVRIGAFLPIRGIPLVHVARHFQ